MDEKLIIQEKVGVEMTKEELKEIMIERFGVCELSDEQFEYCVDVAPVDTAMNILVRVRQKFDTYYHHTDLLSDEKKIKENPDDYRN